MDLPPHFITNIQATYGESGKNWLKQLPEHLSVLSQQWNFRFINIVPNLSYNLVALVKLNATHELAILKTAPAAGSIISESRWLNCVKKGVPRVLSIDEKRNAFLMEYLIPGITLKSFVKQGQDDAATRVICETIIELQSEQSQLSSFRSLFSLSTALPILKGHLENVILSKAQSLFYDLSQDTSEHILLHGDLHHDNILQNGTSWKAIDPHGYIGDKAAEIGSMIHNPFDCFPTERPLDKIIETRLKILCEMLPFDAKRIKAWAFSLTILSAAWDVESFGEIGKDKVKIALAIDKVKC